MSMSQKHLALGPPSVLQGAMVSMGIYGERMECSVFVEYQSVQGACLYFSEIVWRGSSYTQRSWAWETGVLCWTASHGWAWGGQGRNTRWEGWFDQAIEWWTKGVRKRPMECFLCEGWGTGSPVTTFRSIIIISGVLQSYDTWLLFLWNDPAHWLDHMGLWLDTRHRSLYMASNTLFNNNSLCSVFFLHL